MLWNLRGLTGETVAVFTQFFVDLQGYEYDICSFEDGTMGLDGLRYWNIKSIWLCSETQLHMTEKAAPWIMDKFISKALHGLPMRWTYL